MLSTARKKNDVPQEGLDDSHVKFDLVCLYLQTQNTKKHMT